MSTLARSLDLPYGDRYTECIDPHTGRGAGKYSPVNKLKEIFCWLDRVCVTFSCIKGTKSADEVSVISPMSSNFCIREHTQRHAHTHIQISNITPAILGGHRESTTLSQRCRCEVLSALSTLAQQQGTFPAPRNFFQGPLSKFKCFQVMMQHVVQICKGQRHKLKKKKMHVWGYV